METSQPSYISMAKNVFKKKINFLQIEIILKNHSITWTLDENIALYSHSKLSVHSLYSSLYNLGDNNHGSY